MLYLCMRIATKQSFNFLIMTISLDTTMTKAQLINDALAFTKYASVDFYALEYINNILSELRYDMSKGEFVVFKEDINKAIEKADKY